MKRIIADILVIGGGGAGLAAAIAAKRENNTVLLVSSSRIGYGNNTAIAGGALAVADWRLSEDTTSQHFIDTLTGGRFINNPRLVEVMVKRCKERVRDLLTYGVEFAKNGEELFIKRSPGHTYPRDIILKRRLGIGYTVPMIDHVKKLGVRFFEGVQIVKLLNRRGKTSPGGCT